MKVGMSNTQLHPRRQFLSVRTVLSKTVGFLMAFALLTSSCSGDTPIAKIAPTPVERTTYQASAWKLVWSDEFDSLQGAAPDPHKWISDVGGNGWGSHHLEYNTNNNNVYLDGQGNLVIEARKDNPEEYKCWYGPCQYTSARITTRGHFSFTYGLLEARIKIPTSQGIWSAFWLLGSDCETVGWPACGEIDIMENVSPDPNIIYGSTHGPENTTTPYSIQNGSFSDDFHFFALQWDPNRLYFSVDGDNYAILNKASLEKQQNWVYNHPFDIILFISVGGDWPGNPNAATVFPQKMYVSYVRLYQIPDRDLAFQK